MNDTLDHFVGRDKQILSFLEAVHDEPREMNKVLVFTGLQGIGKTFLLDFLRHKLAYKQDWLFIKSQAQAKERNYVPLPIDITQNLAHKLPVGFLDFSDPPRGVHVPHDPVHALLSLVKQLSEFDIEFPYFSFGALLYLTRRGDLGNDAWKLGFPHDEFSFGTELLRVIQQGDVPGTGAIRASIRLGEKIFGSTIGQKWRKRKLDPEEIEKLLASDPQKPVVILDELPNLFVKDLKRSFSQPNPPHRVVLFLDTHEALWGSEVARSISDYDFFHRDEWLRKLLRKMIGLPRVLSLISADTPPLWHRAKTAAIRKNEIEEISLEGFSKTVAENFLKGHEVPKDKWDRALQLSQLDSQDQGHHPLTLSAIAYQDDEVQDPEAAEGNEPTPYTNGPIEQTLQKILRYADREQARAVEALATCLDFDFDLYEILGKSLKFECSRRRFDELTCAPYVRMTSEGSGSARYRIINLVKRAFGSGRDGIYHQANELLLKHYETLANQRVPDAKTRELHHARIINPIMAAQKMTDALAMLNGVNGPTPSAKGDPAT